MTLHQVAQAEKAKADAKLAQAKARIPEDFHDFLITLEQNVKIWNAGVDTKRDTLLQELGCWNNDKAVFIKVALPYMPVDGRVAWARAEHKAMKKRLDIHAPELQSIGNKVLLSVTVESEVYGKTVGSIEVNVGGQGADSTNPFANAQTSAVGRALGFMGYGLIGTGIASAEEVVHAQAAKAGTKGRASEAQQPEPEAKAEPQGQPAPPQKQEAAADPFGNRKAFGIPVNDAKKARPVQHRIMALSEATENRDGSASFEAMLENHEEIRVWVPADVADQAFTFAANTVLNVTGWLNEGTKTLRLAKNAEISIEMTA